MANFDYRERPYDAILPEGTSDLLLPEDLADVVLKDEQSGDMMYLFGAQHLNQEMKDLLGIKK